ncbi:hypothetical protein MPSEU_000331600 [Mayamaea pseudoterrestris]|nr:hypothetical protein MPSEU_000331600 [Mayamaea pseudoterrestris]
MYLGVVDQYGSSSWCSEDVANNVRSAILQCLVATVPYKCNLYANTIHLGDASCYNNQGIVIVSGSMEFSQSQVPTSYVANNCVHETIKTPECVSKLQAVLPNAASLSFGTATLDPTEAPTGMPVTPAPATRFPTLAPSTIAPVTPSPTPRTPTTPKPTDVKTEEPTFQIVLDTDEPTKAETNAPTIKPTKAPARKPTSKPSRKPTRNPTRKPSRKPTRAPLRPTNKPSSDATADAATKAPSQQADDDDDIFIPVAPPANARDDDGANIGGDRDVNGNSTSSITASSEGNSNSSSDSNSDNSLASPSTIAIAAVVGSLFVLGLLVGGAGFRRRRQQRDKESTLEEAHDLESPSSHGNWLLSASVSNIYKTEDSDDVAPEQSQGSPSRHSRPGYYFASSSQGSLSPDRPSKSLTEQDHLGATGEEVIGEDVEEQDRELPSLPPPSTTKTNKILASLPAVGSAAAGVPFHPLRDDDKLMSTPARAAADTPSVASLDSMQHSDSEVSSTMHADNLSPSDPSIELLSKADNHSGRSNSSAMRVKAYNSISPPPPEQAQHSFLWRSKKNRKNKKNPFANFYPLYGGGSGSYRSGSDDNDEEDETLLEQERVNHVSDDQESQDSSVLNTTDYTPDVNWNPDDNSVTSSDRGEDIFSPTVSKEESLLDNYGNDEEELGQEEGVEVTDVLPNQDESWEVPPGLVDQQRLFASSPESVPHRDTIEPMMDDNKSTPPRSSIPSTDSSLSSSQNSPKQSTGSSFNSSFGSAGNEQQQPPNVRHARHQPPLSPNKRSRVMIDPLSEPHADFDNVPSAADPLPTPISHFADSGSFTDKPPSSSRALPRPPSPSNGFTMVPKSPDYAEV